MGALALKIDEFQDNHPVEDAWEIRLKRIAQQAEEAYRQTGIGPDLDFFETKYGKHSDFA